MLSLIPLPRWCWWMCREESVPPEIALAEKAGCFAQLAVRSATDTERPALVRECPSCGAGAFKFCLSPTGLPASVPCPERLQAVSR